MSDSKHSKKQHQLLPAEPECSDPKPNDRRGPGSIGNTVGLITPKPRANGSVVDGKPSAHTNPPARPETPQEEGFWAKISDAVHTGLDVLGFVPGLGAVPDLANAGLYGLEGNVLAAMTSAVAAVPGIGDAAKAGTMVAKGGKSIAREAAEERAKKAAIEAAGQGAKEAVERAVKEKAEKQLAKKAAAEKAQREAPDAAGAPPGRDGAYSSGKPKGPCDHLRRGSRRGSYRGGAHSETRKPRGDARDSHHMPADNVSPLPRRDGPAIQMERFDHVATTSNGSGRESVRYRETLKALVIAGRWRDAMAMEILDVRQVAREAGEARRYNEALSEMLAYFKCLDAHGLLG